MERDQSILGMTTLVFIVGYLIGSRRWNQLRRPAVRLLGDVGLLALNHFVEKRETAPPQSPNLPEASGQG